MAKEEKTPVSYTHLDVYKRQAMDTVKRSALTRGTEAIPGIGDAIGGVTEVIFASAVLVKNGIGVVPHAAAYAYVTYQTAFLKYYYPVEYMAALDVYKRQDLDLQWYRQKRRKH